MFHDDYSRPRARPAAIYQFRRDAPDSIRFWSFPRWIVNPLDWPTRGPLLGRGGLIFAIGARG